jgi:hypothetical protein
MNIQDFLRVHVPRRSKINGFDTEVRLLRARGVSGQGIANFLKLNNVEISARSVNRYFLRHPDHYCPSPKGASVAATKREDKSLCSVCAGFEYPLTTDAHRSTSQAGTNSRQIRPQSRAEGDVREPSPHDSLSASEQMVRHEDDRQTVSAQPGPNQRHSASQATSPISAASRLAAVQGVRRLSRYSTSDEIDVTTPEFIAARTAVRRGE